MRNNAPLPEGVSFREFQLETDHEPVLKLWENAGPGIHVRRSDQRNELAKKLQRDPELFLVAESGGRIIGSVMGGFDGRRGMVYHLAVENAFRKQGIGAALMDELERRFKQKGCIRSYLLVTRDNLEAAKFYEKHGWEQMDILTYGKDIA